MPFEVGKIYPVRDGSHMKKVIVVLPDGRLIVEHMSRNGMSLASLSYRDADGGFNGNTGHRWALVNPDEPTDEEKQLVNRILDASEMRVEPCREALLKIIRELRNEGR